MSTITNPYSDRVDLIMSEREASDSSIPGQSHKSSPNGEKHDTTSSLGLMDLSLSIYLLDLLQIYSITLGREPLAQALSLTTFSC
jgi:hypothetical protein